MSSASTGGAIVLALAATGFALISLVRPQLKAHSLPVELQSGAEPTAERRAMTDAERVDALEQHLSEIATEQKKIVGDVDELTKRERLSNESR